jgi:alanine racemase
MTRVVKFEGRPIWAEISLGALARNLRAIRRHINPPSGRGKRKVLAVVKANAYGHGAVPVAKALAKAGSDWFGVTCTSEGAELREAGVRQPILVLTGFWESEVKRALEYRLTPAITRCEQLRLLERAAASHKNSPRARRVGFHLKIDTGMNRLGIRPSDIECFARTLAECPHLRLEGTFTHFASSEVFTAEQTEQQEKLFRSALERLRMLGLDPGVVHMANSAALTARPSTWGDMVRPGAVLYGYHQFYEPPERKAEMEAGLPVQPALSFRTRLISLRDVPPGEGVGYNARFVARQPARIGVLAAGYADGLVRALSNHCCVVIRGQFVPLVGTISMDLSMADVTGIEGVQVGDVATIYGRDGTAAQYASDVAHSLGTVTSDLLCALGKRVPRFYLP